VKRVSVAEFRPSLCTEDPITVPLAGHGEDYRN